MTTKLIDLIITTIIKKEIKIENWPHFNHLILILISPNNFIIWNNFFENKKNKTKQNRKKTSPGLGTTKRKRINDILGIWKYEIWSGDSVKSSQQFPNIFWWPSTSFSVILHAIHINLMTKTSHLLFSLYFRCFSYREKQQTKQTNEPKPHSFVCVHKTANYIL